MSKEQTPLDKLADDEEPTIEEIINESALDFIINTGGLPKDIESFQSILQKFYKYVIKPEIEKEAKAKVLEALERDLKDLSDCHKAHAEDNPRKEVCQVLHTLIMEKQEQIAQTKQK